MRCDAHYKKHGCPKVQQGAPYGLGAVGLRGEEPHSSFGDVSLDGVHGLFDNMPHQGNKVDIWRTTATGPLNGEHPSGTYGAQS